MNIEQIVGGDAFSSEEHYCPYCKRLVPKKTHKLLNGRLITVQPVCHCESEADDKVKREFEQRKRKSDIESKYSALENSPKYRKCSFDNFEVDNFNRKAFEHAKKYASEFHNISKDLFIYGKPGNGKSHLAAAVGNSLNSLETIVVFCTFTELIERIKGTFSGEYGESEASIMNAICSADLLILDDVGVEKATDFTIDVLFRIVERRTKHYRKTVFTSNYSAKELVTRYSKEIGSIEAQRVVGRIISNAAMVENTGKDRRFSN